MPDFSLSMAIGKRIRRKKFERQIHDHLPGLFRIARGMTNQTCDAEDLVHDACVKALCAFDRVEFSDQAALYAYLNRILINTFRDNYRRTQRSPVRPIEHHVTSDTSQNVVEMVISTEPSPVESMSHHQFSVAIHYAFSSLPPEVRVVCVLFLISGLSYKSIAEITDCPIGTVMSRLARGRKLLRTELSGYDPQQNDDPNTQLGGGVHNESL